jgi:hypothetical protein
MMMKKLFIGVLAVLLMSSITEAREVSGKDIPESMNVGDNSLLLNGAGTRTTLWMSIYAAGLYLPKKMQKAQEIIDADTPMAIKIHVISGFMSAKKLEKAFREGFEQSTNGNPGPLKTRIDKFILAQKAEVNKDDILDYVYIPDKGISVFSKGKLSTTIEGLDFKKAVFGIWLCDNPCDEDLKQALLGK